MRRFSKLLILVGMTAALIVPINTAAAATTALTYNIAGIEYAANVAQSSSAGAAVSASKTEIGVWNAVVLHDTGDITTGVGSITGGSFAFRSKLHSLTGSITGGTFGPATGTCAKRTFGVHGVLSGEGSFDVTLTRYGFMRSGTCVVYFATVRGTATLAFPS